MSTRRANLLNVVKPNLVNRAERRSPRRTKTPSSNELKNKCHFSPKGKRKLDFPFKGKRPGLKPVPLAGKLFYLDLNGYRHATQLKKAIEQLGGTIEEFFRKEVTYLVTSRGDCGKSPSSQSTTSPGTPSSIPLTKSSSVKKYIAASPMSTDSPQGMDTQSQVPKGTMRGKSIAQRSAGLRKGSTDILINAGTWGVKIIHVDDVINWISQLMLKVQAKQETSKQKTASPSKHVSQTKLPKVIALKETYLKVEDLCFKYRPLVHEFKVWPEITVDSSNVCPFDPRKRRSSGNSFTKGNSGKGSVKKPRIYERPRHGYCECCEVRYADLDTHLKGKQHKNFARKESNYISLDKAINEGPKIEDLLKEINLKRSSSCSNIAPVPKKNNLPVSYEDSDDVSGDEVLLLSTPSKSQQDEKTMLNSTASNKENLINGAQEKTPVEEKSCECYDLVQNVGYVSKSMPKVTVNEGMGDKEIVSSRSRPATRLQKASSNLSSPSERNHFLSNHKHANSDETSIKNKKCNGKNKRKSAEIEKDCKQLEISPLSDRMYGDVANKALDDTEDEHCLPKCTTKKASETCKKNDKAEIQLSDGEKTHQTESKHKFEKNMKKPNVPAQLALKNHKEECSKSNQSAHKTNAFQYSTVTTNEDREANPQSKSPKTSSNSVDECRSTLNEPVSEDGNLFTSPQNQRKKDRDNLETNQKPVDCRMCPNDGIEPNRKGSELSRKLRKRKVIINSSDTEVGEQDSPRLRTPVKNFPNENYFAMCPGALIEDENTVTVRSDRRRNSAVGECKLSPISPCNQNGEYSVRSSCSEDIAFLPYRIYSSFGSSLGGVSRDVNYLVDRIGEDVFIDDGNELEIHNDADETLVDPAPDTLSEYGDIIKDHNIEPSSPKTKDLLLEKVKGQMENTELQVSVTYINLDEISPARGKDSDACINFKRKRNEEEPIKARKCKRLSDNSDFHRDDLIESGYTSESETEDIYRSSVAERVKLQRAINLSLQECGLPSTASEPLSSPQVQLTGRKRKNVLQSSPFAEITNTCKRKRERAKSEVNARSIIRPSQHRKSRQPRSACLIPNDPFSFDDY